MLVDHIEREQSLNVTRSFIVQAPAGSGKTSLLICRFLALLAVAEKNPEECLAITFTRKAAAEMQIRVLDALTFAKNNHKPEDPYEHQVWQLGRKVIEKDKLLGWGLLENPNRLKIQTIDALCANITTMMPVATFGAQPEVHSDPMHLYKTAVNELLLREMQSKTYSASFLSLLKHLDNNYSTLQRLFVQMLPLREQWLPYLVQAGAAFDAREILEYSLKMVITDSLQQLDKFIPYDCNELLELAKYAANNVLNTEIAVCKKLDGAWPNSDDLDVWLGMAELLLTKDNKLRRTVTNKQGFMAPSAAKDKAEKEELKLYKNRFKELLIKLEDHHEFIEHLSLLRSLPSNCYNDQQWEVVEALTTLLPLLAAQLKVTFQKAGKVDFVEISLVANAALGELDNPTDLSLLLDYKIKHILVDEYQDISISQNILLEKLTAGWEIGDGRTLFLVGDPMQSIYRFRQAEVGLFINAKQYGVGNVPLMPLSLSTNFRSTENIVDWVNKVFNDKFPKISDPILGAIAYSDSMAVKETEELSGVECYQTIEDEAEKVIDIIKQAKQVDPNASIAILVRARGHLQEIIPALQTAEIAYQGVDIDLLINKPIIQDLFALTRALLHLGDRIAWLSVLRSSWCRLSLADLCILAEKDHKTPIWKLMQQNQQNLSKDAQNKLQHVISVFENAWLRQGRQNLYDWVWQTWKELEHQIATDHSSSSDIDAFFELLDEEADNISEITYFKGKLEKLYSKNKIVDANAVQIMTIHKAKGLEFDTVILPGMERRSAADQQQLLLWDQRPGIHADNYLLLAPIKSADQKVDPIYFYLRTMEKIRKDNESLRLLYVAVTRAKRNLHILGCIE